MSQPQYLRRLYHRREYQELKTNIIFGLTIGWVFTLTGTFKTFFLLEGGIAPVMLGAGLTSLAVTLIAPHLMAYPQSFMKKIATVVGTALFKAILTAVYFAAVLPAGLTYQRFKGQDPFYYWDSTPPATIEGWVNKDSTASVLSSQPGRKAAGGLAILQPLQVFSYFIYHSEWIFLPCLIILLVLGLVGIFVQSTALAPFIYTLF